MGEREREGGVAGFSGGKEEGDRERERKKKIIKGPFLHCLLNHMLLIYETSLYNYTFGNSTSYLSNCV